VFVVVTLLLLTFFVFHSYHSHLKRLTALRLALDPDHPHDHFDFAATEALVTPRVQQAMTDYIRDHPTHDGELKITLAMRVSQAAAGRSIDELQLEDTDVFVCVDDLHQPPPNLPVSVEVSLLGGRSNPTVKHADWISQRQHLERSKRPETNEVVLADKTESLLEGLQSNFACLDAYGSLVTAPSELILEGTMMACVLQCCARLGVPVIRKCPQLQLISTWTGNV
jgi:branched-subunit amino acid aminotransferase/4-amino-4-deoxychorismate lyase